MVSREGPRPPAGHRPRERLDRGSASKESVDASKADVERVTAALPNARVLVPGAKGTSPMFSTRKGSRHRSCRSSWAPTERSRDRLGDRSPRSLLMAVLERPCPLSPGAHHELAVVDHDREDRFGGARRDGVAGHE